jgi:hypothetical protein
MLSLSRWLGAALAVVVNLAVMVNAAKEATPSPTPAPPSGHVNALWRGVAIAVIVALALACCVVPRLRAGPGADAPMVVVVPPVVGETKRAKLHKTTMLAEMGIGGAAGAPSASSAHSAVGSDEKYAEEGNGMGGVDVDVEMAAGSQHPLSCPRGHTLVAFAAPNGRHGCDGCGACGLPEGSPLRGCRACDFDLCESCAAKARDDARGRLRVAVSARKRRAAGSLAAYGSAGAAAQAAQAAAGGGVADGEGAAHQPGPYGLYFRDYSRERLGFGVEATDRGRGLPCVTVPPGGGGAWPLTGHLVVSVNGQDLEAGGGGGGGGGGGALAQLGSLLKAAGRPVTVGFQAGPKPRPLARDEVRSTRPSSLKPTWSRSVAWCHTPSIASTAKARTRCPPSLARSRRPVRMRPSPRVVSSFIVPSVPFRRRKSTSSSLRPTRWASGWRRTLWTRTGGPGSPSLLPPRQATGGPPSRSVGTSLAR